MAHRDGVVLDVDERPEFGQWVGLSLQHMFSMFGSTVLVPILVGLNPGIALFSSLYIALELIGSDKKFIKESLNLN